MSYANLGLRFLLELCLLAALGYWGFHNGDGTAARWALGIGGPMVAAIIWGMFLAPKAAVKIPLAARVTLEVVLFGVAAVGLAAAGQPGLGIALAVLYAVNRLLLFLIPQ